MAHMTPLDKETHPDLAEDFALFESILGFVPNSLLTMQRKPGMVKGFGALTRAVMDPEGEMAGAVLTRGGWTSRKHGR